MQLHVLGVKRVSGTSGKGAYDFANLLVKAPIQPFSRGQMCLEGFGSETAEMPCKPEVLKQLESLRCPDSWLCELEQEAELRQGKVIQVVTSIRRVDAVKKAA